MPDISRRQYLASAGAAVAAAVGLSSRASAAGVPELATPDSVTLSYDEERLRKYQPRMITSTENRPRITGLYGYIAEDSERDLTAYAYWLQLTHQSGLPGVSQDSHLGDHEPVYVFVDADGVPTSVVYSGYHHYAAAKSLGEDDLVADRAADPTHVDALRITDPYHHYLFDPAATSGFVDLDDWLSVRDSWARNDFYAKTENAAVDDPFTMLTRDTWWADGTRDRQFALLWRFVGIGGASAADETRGSLF